MRRVAIKSLVFRRARTVLTALAVVLGVSMIAGTYVLTDTIDRAFSGIFNASYQDTSVVVSGRQIVKGSASGNATIPASLVQKLRGAPHVQAAAGALMDLSTEANSTKILDRRGKPVGGDTNLGVGIDASQPRFNPLELTSGRWAAGAGEVVIDRATADKNGFEVGESVGISARGPVRHMRITGLARYGKTESLGGATIAVFDIPTAQAVVGKPGQLDTISLAATPGVSDARLAREIAPLLPRTAQVQTGAQRAHADAKDTKDVIKFLRYFLLAFAVLALFVGAFVIFNTLSITVAQRSREFAMLRSIGATRRQVLRSVLLEGAITGVLASAAGLVLGIGLARGLSALMNAMQMALPDAPSVIATRTVAVSMLVGSIVTVLATIVPALRATRVAPIAAVTEGAVVPSSRRAGNVPRAAVATLALSLAALLAGGFAHGLGTGTTLLAYGGGVLGLFVGVAMVAPRLVRPLTSVVGAPSNRFAGFAGRLANENARRNPRRTASTAAALMIGLALVTVVATLGASLRHSTTAALRDQVAADYVVTSGNGFAQFSKQATKALPAVPGIGVASTVLDDRAHVLGSDAQVEGVDAATIGKTYNFGWVRGSSDADLAALGDDGALVKKSYADKHHLARGSVLQLTGPSGRRLAVRVRGIYDPPAFDKIGPVLGPITISQRAFAATFPRGKVLYAFVKLDRDASPALVGRVGRELQRFPGTKLQTRDAWATERASAVNKLLNLLYVLLALSIVVSLFGMINTLVLAVFERTRELGMLRAIGMSRRQVRRTIRHESTITALIGAGLGLPLGLFLAGIVTRALSDQGLTFVIPGVALATLVTIAIAAGVVAAIVPARRAARLDVLTAVHHE